RDTAPLFDTDRFCRGIEAAYTKMWEIWQTGATPESFAPLTRTNATSSRSLKKEALAIKPDSADALNNRGNALVELSLPLPQQPPARRREPRDAAAPPAEGEPADSSRLLEQAIFVHQRGRLTEAERLYLKILEVQPDHFDALHLLGVIRHQQGRDV